MKKRFTTLATAICLVSVCILPTSAAQASGSTAPYTMTLKPDMQNEEVAQLQRDLQTLGYFTYDTITGYYGSMTEEAVQNFQAAYGLTADGVAGPRTLHELNHAMTKQAMIHDSYNYLNTPYVWGGTSPNPGFDCSGFVYYMMNQHSIKMIRTTSVEMYKMGEWVSLDKLQLGDLVFFSLEGTGKISHVGFYVGDGTFISALSSKGIYVQSLINNSYWSPRYMGAKRVY